jgi:ParB family chromosome partitioning protein
MTTKKIALDKIAPDPGQPRKLFDTKALHELAASISENGLIQPITVRADRKAGHYIIVAGERRWRAHCLLRDSGTKGFASIVCNVVKPGSKADTRIKQIVENVARADMTILEEADALSQLVTEFGLTEEEIAKRLGLAPFRVKWRLQLQNLTPEIRKMVEGDQLDRQQAMEVSRLHHRDQARIVRMINRGDLVGWKAVRNAVDAILQGTTQADIFGAGAPKPSGKEIAELKAMEIKVARVAGMVASGWKDGQCVVAAKVSPDRAARIADQLAAIRSAIVIMERELRNVTAQAKIVLRA